MTGLLQATAQDDADIPMVRSLTWYSEAISLTNPGNEQFPPGHLVHPVRLSGYPAKIVPIACDEQAKVWVRGK